MRTLCLTLVCFLVGVLIASGSVYVMSNANKSPFDDETTDLVNLSTQAPDVIGDSFVLLQPPIPVIADSFVDVALTILEPIFAPLKPLVKKHLIGAN